MYRKAQQHCVVPYNDLHFFYSSHKLLSDLGCKTCPGIQLAPGFNLPRGSTCPGVQPAPAFNRPQGSTCPGVQPAPGFNLPRSPKFPYLLSSLFPLTTVGIFSSLLHRSSNITYSPVASMQ